MKFSGSAVEPNEFNAVQIEDVQFDIQFETVQLLQSHQSVRLIFSGELFAFPFPPLVFTLTFTLFFRFLITPLYFVVTSFLAIRLIFAR